MHLSPFSMTLLQEPRAVRAAFTNPVRLPAELIDGICEAVVSHPDEAIRCEVICRLTREIFESLAWLHDDPSHHELASLNDS